MSISKLLVPLGLLVLSIYVLAAPVLLPKNSDNAQQITLQLPVSQDLQLGKLAIHSFRAFPLDRNGRESLTLTRSTDTATAALSRAMADGSILPSATLIFTEPGVHPKLVTCVLTDVVITSLSPVPETESSRGQREEITLTFSGATITRVPARPYTSDDCSS